MARIKKHKPVRHDLPKEYKGWDVFCITINTDASYMHHTKKGGFAYWIVLDKDRKITNSGPIKYEINDALDAEIAAIGNAIAHLLSLDDLPSVKLLVFNIDCVPAYHQIVSAGNPRPIAKQVRSLLGKLKARVRPHKTNWKHVKAHTKEKDARSYVNNWCDIESRKHAKN